jgi:DNA-binding NtrC family response regulator
MSDYRNAEKHFRAIEEHPHEGIVAFSWAFVKAEVLKSVGRFGEALGVLESIPQTVTKEERQAVLMNRIHLWFTLGREGEARELLERSGGELLPFQRTEMGIYGALLRNDLAFARKEARRLLASPHMSPVKVRRIVLYMVQMELAARQAHAARVLLRTVDLTETAPDCVIEWARLHLLEGHEDLAVDRFRRALELKNDYRVHAELMNAHELSAAQLSRLWERARKQSVPGMRTGSTDRSAPGSDAPSTSGPRDSIKLQEAAGEALVGESPVMLRIKDDTERFASLDETVLITGETGTGKELVARMLHDRSPRVARPYLAVNCAAISDTLLETELFGHVKGAFTGADRAHEGLLVAAGDGTIFFDEVGSMSPRVQASLLRVLEERKVRPVGGTRSVAIACRMIAATNQPLEDLIVAGTFRSDLLYRLARLEIRIPPLRQRREDIPLLARHFLGRFFEYGDVALGDGLLAALRARDWPGNVRELRNEIERIAILSGGAKVLDAALLRSAPVAPPSGARVGIAVEGATPALLGGTRGRLQRLRALFDGHRELARGDVVRLLGCAPTTAARMLAALEKERFLKRIWPTPAPRTSYFVRANQD